LIAGGILGAYVTSSIYGSKEEHEAAVLGTVKCTPCPVCQAAVPSPSTLPIKPAPEEDDDNPTPHPRTSTKSGVKSASAEPDLQPGRPGLPASAIKLASEALRRELGPCIETARAADGHGSLVLDLVVTATSGIGHIRSAALASVSGALGGLDGCAIEAAKRVQFAWTEDDGESKLRYPVTLGN
jgi:hypothetical protein